MPLELLSPSEIAVSIAQVVEGELADPKAAIRWVRGLPAADPEQGSGPGGCRWVQLDVSRRGLRPRELGRSARRDLAAHLRRLDLLCSGADLWIPASHFADPARVDRCVLAVDLACELIADIGAAVRVVSVNLPAELAADVLTQLEASAERCGVRLADHGVVGGNGSAGMFAEPARRSVGLDPASCFIAGVDPLAGAARAGERLASARLSDLSSVGRCVPGTDGGRLDLMAWSVSLVTAGYRAPVVVDLRGLPEVMETAPKILERWRSATAFAVG